MTPDELRERLERFIAHAVGAADVRVEGLRKLPGGDQVSVLVLSAKEPWAEEAARLHRAGADVALKGSMLSAEFIEGEWGNRPTLNAEITIESPSGAVRERASIPLRSKHRFDLYIP